MAGRISLLTGLQDSLLLLEYKNPFISKILTPNWKIVGFSELIIIEKTTDSTNNPPHPELLNYLACERVTKHHRVRG